MDIEKCKKRLFHVLQNCNYEDLKKLTKEEEYSSTLNQTDEFDWTPLMVAVAAGSKECVELLMDSIATANLTKEINTDNIFKIMNRMNTTYLIQLLSKYMKFDQIKSIIDKNEKSPKPELFKFPVRQIKRIKKSKKRLNKKNGNNSQKDIKKCKICKNRYNVLQQDLHEMEIIHLHALSKKAIRDGSCTACPKIDLSQKYEIGYKMIKHIGWDGESGLGLHEQGTKQPVEAKFKCNRRGLGLILEKNKKNEKAKLNDEFKKNKVDKIDTAQIDRSVAINFRREFYE
ncbi:hypothetical protein A3Q56_01939 [Intoshia linei]|uniref:G-patch domain-containing protein n=1 Tax=Intoshia linei TaxID=1819745 RepID=A0A177B9E6_9BILA|nr:hypothetical protein A3Q56_01939 [Intoshia linei]